MDECLPITWVSRSWEKCKNRGIRDLSLRHTGEREGGQYQTFCTRPCSCCPSSEPRWSHSSLSVTGVAYVWQNALLLCREKLEEASQIFFKKMLLGHLGSPVASKAKNILMVFQQIINTWTALDGFKDCC